MQEFAHLLTQPSTNPTRLSQPTLLIHRPCLCLSVIHVDPPTTSWTWGGVVSHIVSVYVDLIFKPFVLTVPFFFLFFFLQFKGRVMCILTEFVFDLKLGWQKKGDNCILKQHEVIISEQKSECLQSFLG